MKCLTPEPFIKPEIREKFKYFTEDGRILLFSAPCGFGKTTSARQLLKDISYSEILADTADFGSFKTDEKSDIYFIDDLRNFRMIMTNKRYILLYVITQTQSLFC